MDEFDAYEHKQIHKSADFLALNSPLGAGTVTPSGDIAVRSVTVSPSSPYNVTAPAGAVAGLLYDNGGFEYNLKHPTFGAKGDGVTDDSVGVAAWLAAVKNNNSSGVAPSGVYICTAAQSMTAAAGVRLRGAAAGSQLGVGSILKYTGGGAGVAFTFTGSSFVGCERLGFQYNNGAFTGTLMSITGSGGFVLRDCPLTGNGVSSALYLLNADNTTEVMVENPFFSGAQYALLGANPAGGTACNGMTILGGVFNAATTAHIRNTGGGWSLSGVVFEPGGGTSGNAIAFPDAPVVAGGLSLNGCWFGDATANGAWAWVQFQGNGLSIQGCIFNGTGFNANLIVSIVGASSGITIQGNNFRNALTAVALGASLASNIVVAANNTSTVTNLWTGTPAGNAWFMQTGTSLPWDVWSNGGRMASVDSTGKLTLGGNLAAATGTFANGLQVTGGIFQPGTPAQGAQTGALYFVSGVPSNANGGNGDWAFRTDVSTAGNRVYHKEAGAWVATAA